MEINKYKLDSMDKQDIEHIKKQQFTCDLCAMSFPLKLGLKYHLTIHTGLGLYDCEICSANFIQVGHLKRHSRIHSGEKQ